MSRCLPFPPPGYVRNSASGDALIESIKIEREKEKIKQERKEQKRREREERKKERKEKKREKENLKSIQSIEGTYKRKRDSDGFDKLSDNSWVNSKDVHMQKKKELEAEQNERSSLTEEFGQPILSESLSYSSDGTQSKTKKSKVELSPSDGNRGTQGKVIRFRLKRRETENAQPTNDVPSTSGRTGAPAPKIIDVPPLSDQSCGVAPVCVPLPALVTNDGSKEFNPRPMERKYPVSTPAAKSAERTQNPKSPYDALFSELLPRAIQCDSVEGTGNDDDQWLFLNKKQAARDRVSLKAYDGVSGQRNSSLLPCAHLLPEVDLYALPFTVLF
uniref:Uncharacterized protein n=1 Tax=Kalanchoe fedtschenkoi TaxID=63787 RepID=A0A7N0SVE7_KALFE